MKKNSKDIFDLLNRINMSARENLDFLKSPSSYLFSTRRRSRGLTYSTLKFMRSTCGKSSENYTRKDSQALSLPVYS